MKVRLQNIPPEGLDLEFTLDHAALSARVEPDLLRLDSNAPEYRFPTPPVATLHLTAEARTVYISGSATGEYAAPCSRCAEDTTQRFNVPVQIVLKPHSERSRPEEEVEDLQLGYFDGTEFDCDPIAQEFVILALPYKVLCKSDCKGLCPTCGTNFNVGICSCRATEEAKDDRFAVLKQLKIQ